jgi:hypothetical protein
MVNQSESVSGPARRSRTTGNGSVRIPVGWRTVRFECRIQVLEERPESASAISGPVRLRASDVADGCGRLEIFCGEAGLCGASAGHSRG